MSETKCVVCDEEVDAICFNCTLREGLIWDYDELTYADTTNMHELGFILSFDRDNEKVIAIALPSCKLFQKTE